MFNFLNQSKMKKVSFLLAFLFIGTIAFAQKKNKVAEVEIQTSAKCGMCKQRIERDLGLTKGVESAKLDLNSKVVTVKYNTKKMSEADVKKAISTIGYDADEVVANEKSHDQLPGCCQKTSKAHKD